MRCRPPKSLQLRRRHERPVADSIRLEITRAEASAGRRSPTGDGSLRGSIYWHILPVEVSVVFTRNVVLSQHQYEL